MATIGETIDLDVPIGVARKKWNEYVSGMVIGSGLGPREREYPFRWRKAEREAEQGALQFAAIGDGITRLTVALEFPELGSDEPAEGEDVELQVRPERRQEWADAKACPHDDGLIQCDGCGDRPPPAGREEEGKTVLLVPPEVAVRKQLPAGLQHEGGVGSAQAGGAKLVFGPGKKVLEAQRILLDLAATPVRRHEDRDAGLVASFHESAEVIPRWCVHASPPSARASGRKAQPPFAELSEEIEVVAQVGAQRG